MMIWSGFFTARSPKSVVENPHSPGMSVSPLALAAQGRPAIQLKADIPTQDQARHLAGVIEQALPNSKDRPC
jgi:hypothetical protein